MTWRTLRAGALVGVVAPAGPGESEPTTLVEPLLASFDLQARLHLGCFACDGFLAGPDALRLHDLHAAFADPQLDAVWCLRGGYGSGRLLDRVDTPCCAATGKPVLGGWRAGHGTPNRPLPLGARVRLDATRGTLTLMQDVIRP